MAEQDREYLVGSVWPTNRSGVLGDTELDGRLPPGIKLVHVTMDFQEGTAGGVRPAPSLATRPRRPG